VASGDPGSTWSSSRSTARHRSRIAASFGELTESEIVETRPRPSTNLALAALFGADVTVLPGKCDHCGAVHLIGELDAFVRAPGTVLRCPDCHGVILRVVETAEATYLDARGAAYLRFQRQVDLG
jgi:Family of unknown function (DUF6510)